MLYVRPLKEYRPMSLPLLTGSKDRTEVNCNNCGGSFVVESMRLQELNGYVICPYCESDDTVQG